MLALYMTLCIELSIVKRKTKRKREKVRLRRVTTEIYKSKNLKGLITAESAENAKIYN